MSQLYLTDNKLKVGCRDGQITVHNLEDETDHAVPLSNVDGISVFGCPQLSTQLIRTCMQSNIAIGYYSDEGHYFGRISSNQSVNPLRQKRQVMLTDNPEFCLVWSKRVVTAKIQNSLALLRSMSNVYQFSDEELHGLHHSLDSVDAASTVDEVMGYEGNAAKSYFSCLPHLVEKEEFVFKGRTSRPPRDPFNSIISYGYSLLYRNIIGAIERHGLHPYFAYMHQLKGGHAALASDLVEEFRAPVVDRTALHLVNDGMVEPEDFYENGQGAVYFKRDVAKRITDAFSAVIVKRYPYYKADGDGKTYGFQAVLDKKILTLVDAIDHGDATLYRPVRWELSE